MKFPDISAFTNKIPNGITRTIGRTGLITRKHSPTILFGVGIVGVTATVVLACRATLKLDDVVTELDEKIEKARLTAELGQEEFTEDDLQKFIFHNRVATAGQIARLYLPALAVGLVSVCALTGSHVVLTRRNFGLTAAYATVEKAFGDYRKRVSSELGEEKENDFYNGIETHEIAETLADGSKVITKVKVQPKGVGGGMYSICFDQVNSPTNWSSEPVKNQLFLNCQERFANQRLARDGYLFLNDVYEALGLPKTRAGQVVGWLYNSANGDEYIDFGAITGNSPSQVRDFVNGNAPGVWLNFNVDGNIWDKIADWKL